MDYKLKIILCRNKINFYLLLEGNRLNKSLRDELPIFVGFSELVLFALASSELVVCLAILVFYQPLFRGFKSELGDD